MKTEQLHRTALPSIGNRNRGGLEVYQTALRCVKNEDLKKEWQK